MLGVFSCHYGVFFFFFFFWFSSSLSFLLVLKEMCTVCL